MNVVSTPHYRMDCKRVKGDRGDTDVLHNEAQGIGTRFATYLILRRDRILVISLDPHAVRVMIGCGLLAIDGGR